MRIRMGMLVAAGLACLAGTAHAQVVGTFMWQTQPFCNHVTLTITQQGGVYQLTGVDDQCGAFSAPVYGTAVATSTGVNMGFSAAFGTGRTAHLTAVVSVATVSGTWADGEGQAGTFAFNGVATGGIARPGPAALPALATIPSGVTVTGEFIFDGHQPTSASPNSDVMSINLLGRAPVALTDTDVNFAAGTGAADADATCTGTVAAPTAPRGKVCIYSQGAPSGINLSSLLGRVNSLPKQSFLIQFIPLGTGSDMYLYLTWAYTAP